MSQHTDKLAGRIDADTLAQAAAQGVQRALAARGLTELTPEQTREVSGAALASPTSSLLIKQPIIYGLWQPIDTKTLGSLGTLNTAQF
ncbi:MAG: hypothetical protein QM742_14475 [Aquabacterium sp.]